MAGSAALVRRGGGFRHGLEPHALAFNLLGFLAPGVILAWCAFAWRSAATADGWMARIGLQLSMLSADLSAVIVLYGVEVTAANARLRRHRPDEIPAAPAPRV